MTPPPPSTLLNTRTALNKQYKNSNMNLKLKSSSLIINCKSKIIHTTAISGGISNSGGTMKASSS